MHYDILHGKRQSNLYFQQKLLPDEACGLSYGGSKMEERT